MSECNVPGSSVAKVAMSHGINTNVVHGWRKLVREGGGPLSLTSRGFVPVTVEPSCARPIAERDFAAWTRELLR